MDTKNELRDAELENVAGGLTLSDGYFDIMIELVVLWKEKAYYEYGKIYFGKIDTLYQGMRKGCEERNYEYFNKYYQEAKKQFPCVNVDTIEAVLKTQLH